MPNGYDYQIIYKFGAKRNDSSDPTGLLSGGLGILYGTATRGGGKGRGTVFEISLVKGRYVETILHSFVGSDGSEPAAPLINVGGTLYGTTMGGGATHGLCNEGCGTAFSLVLY
jgi:uncharacterized repeat protein (TIGR03803 family)